MRDQTTHLRDYQARVFHGLLAGMDDNPGETFTVLFPRQAGKNEVQAWLVEHLLRRHAGSGGEIVVCAPTLEPQALLSLNRVLRIAAEHDPGYAAHDLAVARGNVVSLGAARATYLSASPAAHVTGHTASLALIADEAQEIDAPWFERQFRPMTASTGAPAVLFGTPWDSETLLDIAVARNRGKQTGSLGPLHFQVGWREVAQERPLYGRHVRQRRDELGAESPIFRSQYELETVSTAGRMFGPEALANIQGSHTRLLGPRPGERYVAGLDIGGDSRDADATVFTVGRMGDDAVAVVAHLVWRGAAFTVVEAAVIEAARRWGLAKLCVDATGMGAPIAARLEDALGHTVAPITFSEAVKSDLGFALSATIAGGRLSIYKDTDGEAPALWAELRACRAETTPAGRLRWGDDRGHDDFVVSLALVVRAAALAGRPRVAFGRKRE